MTRRAKETEIITTDCTQNAEAVLRTGLEDKAKEKAKAKANTLPQAI